MDDADKADEHMEREMAARLLSMRPRGPTLRPALACHYCDEPVAGAQLFCGSACADDWHREARARASLGRPKD